MLVVLKLHIRQRELPQLLHENLLRPVDHDLRDGIILQKRLQGTKPQHLVTDFRDKARALPQRHRIGIRLQYPLEVLVDDIIHQTEIIIGHVLRRNNALLLGRDLLHDLAMDHEFQILRPILGDIRLAAFTGGKDHDLQILPICAPQARQQ